MALSLRYDPYSANAMENYLQLREELSKIDIVGLLNEQLARSQIHIATTKKIVAALRHIDPEYQLGAVVSLLDNMTSLHPIASLVLIAVRDIAVGLSVDQKEIVCSKVRSLYEQRHEVMQVPLHVAYAVRILGLLPSVTNQTFLHRCFEEQPSVLVRRDVILIFANWQNFPWLSLKVPRFDTMSVWERRAAILASFYMEDEGKHWRQHADGRFTPMETLVRTWRAEKQPGFELPLS
jgi:hypothetical protein